MPEVGVFAPWEMDNDSVSRDVDTLFQVLVKCIVKTAAAHPIITA